MPHPGPVSRSGKLLLGFLALVLFNSFFLADYNRLPYPPREPFIAFFYEGNVLLHLLLGLVALILLLRLGGKLRRAVVGTAWLGRLIGFIALAALGVCMVAGIGLVIFGNLRPQAGILLAHGLGALVATVGAVLWLMARSAGRDTTMPAQNSAELISAAPLLLPRRAAGVIAGFLIPGFLLMLGGGSAGRRRRAGVKPEGRTG